MEKKTIDLIDKGIGSTEASTFTQYQIPSASFELPIHEYQSLCEWIKICETFLTSLLEQVRKRQNDMSEHEHQEKESVVPDPQGSTTLKKAVITLLVIIIAAVGSYITKMANTSNTVTPSPTPFPSPQPTPSVSPSPADRETRYVISGTVITGIGGGPVRTQALVSCLTTGVRATEARTDNETGRFNLIIHVPETPERIDSVRLVAMTGNGYRGEKTVYLPPNGEITIILTRNR